MKLLIRNVLDDHLGMITFNNLVPGSYVFPGLLQLLPEFLIFRSDLFL